PSAGSSNDPFGSGAAGTTANGAGADTPNGFPLAARRGSTAEQTKRRPREVTAETAARWAQMHDIPTVVETSALTGEGVDEAFERLARMILTKIELGEIDPDDPRCGVQYGDAPVGVGVQKVRSGRRRGSRCC